MQDYKLKHKQPNSSSQNPDIYFSLDLVLLETVYRFWVIHDFI